MQLTWKITNEFSKLINNIVAYTRGLIKNKKDWTFHTFIYWKRISCLTRISLVMGIQYKFILFVFKHPRIHITAACGRSVQEKRTRHTFSKGISTYMFNWELGERQKLFRAFLHKKWKKKTTKSKLFLLQHKLFSSLMCYGSSCSSYSGVFYLLL